jgi:hypothetical protein
MTQLRILVFFKSSSDLEKTESANRLQEKRTIKIVRTNLFFTERVLSKVSIFGHFYVSIPKRSSI